jgi:hypothetical protein
MASLNSRHYERNSFHSRDSSRSRTRHYYGDSSTAAPSSKGHDDSHHGSMRDEYLRRSSPTHGDRLPGHRDRWEYDEYDRYAPNFEEGDRDRSTSERSVKRRGNSSLCSSFSSGQRRDRSLSRDEEYSYHPGSFASEHEGQLKQTLPRPHAEWPPCFDKDGSLFVFDTRSAMFYESLSDFFYDPKSKLYFGNRKGAYFRYDSAQHPPFVEVQKVDDAVTSASQEEYHGTMDPLPIQGARAGGQLAETLKPKIAIKLKSKKVKSSAGDTATISVIETSTPAVMPKAHKQKIANIEKWTEKQAELKHESVAKGLVGGSTAASRPAIDVRMTAKGEPICVVCRRKFPSIDKLKLHEQASTLHKQNLEKLKEQEFDGPKRKSPDVASTEAAPEYQDRAAKRRQLHGPPTSNALGLRLASNTSQYHDRPAKGEALDESHLGHKMLQKLGWKGHENEDGTNERSKSAVASDQLRREWDRIESLAGNPIRPTTSHSHNK